MKPAIENPEDGQKLFEDSIHNFKLTLAVVNEDIQKRLKPNAVTAIKEKKKHADKSIRNSV